MHFLQVCTVIDNSISYFISFLFCEFFCFYVVFVKWSMADSYKTIHSEGRKIITNVIRHFDEEKNIGYLIIPLDNATKRAAIATGVSERTISTIRKESKVAEATGSKLSTPGKKRKPSSLKISLDKFDCTALRNIIHSFYTVKKEVPSLRKIHSAATSDLNFKGNKETLRKIINSLGFWFKKYKNNRHVLMERSDIVAWRSRYLRTLKRNSECDHPKQVTYVGETSIDPHYTASSCCQSNGELGVRKNNTSDQKFIIVHAGGRNGFIPGARLMFKAQLNPGIYHNEMNFEKFKRWAEEKLIPNLPPNGLIIIDNASYHSVQANKPPTQAARKIYIQNWLKENNVTVDENVSKSELLELVKLCRPQPTYKIDELFNNHGHQIVRLPPCHCDLNPIELVWNIVKDKVADKNININQRAGEIEELVVLEAIESVSVEEWKDACVQVQKLEQQYWESDKIIEDEIENVLIRLGDASDDESSSSASSEDDDMSDSEDDTMTGIEPLLFCQTDLV